MSTMTQNASMASGTQRLQNLATYPLAAWIAYVFVWYLQYKFTGNPGSMALFTTLTDWLGFHGHEQIMRIGTGSFELAASIILFIPRMMPIGAVMALGTMSGAIFFHLVSPLGIDPYNDGGYLFKEACATWLAAVTILVLRRREAIAMLRRILPV